MAGDFPQTFLTWHAERGMLHTYGMWYDMASRAFSDSTSAYLCSLAFGFTSVLPNRMEVINLCPPYLPRWASILPSSLSLVFESYPVFQGPARTFHEALTDSPWLLSLVRKGPSLSLKVHSLTLHHGHRPECLASSCFSFLRQQNVNFPSETTLSYFSFLSITMAASVLGLPG